MGLIICPECKNQISEFATKCPHCGYPFPKSNNSINELKPAISETENEKETTKQEKIMSDSPSSDIVTDSTKTPNKLKTKKGIIIGGSLGIICIIIALVLLLPKGSSNSEDIIIGKWSCILQGDSSADIEDYSYDSDGMCTAVFNNTGSGIMTISNSGKSYDLYWEFDREEDEGERIYSIRFNGDDSSIDALVSFDETEDTYLMVIGNDDINLIFVKLGSD